MQQNTSSVPSERPSLKPAEVMTQEERLKYIKKLGAEISEWSAELNRRLA